MNAPLDYNLDDVIVRALGRYIAELERELRAARSERDDWKTKAIAPPCEVCGEAFTTDDHIAVRHTHHSFRTVVPHALRLAVNDLLARLDGRDDIGSKTRLAILAVRQEIEAARDRE